MSNPYFKKMKLKEKAYRSDGSLRLDEIVASQKYTHFMIKYDGTHIDLEITLPDTIRLLTREGNDVAHLVPYIVEDIRANMLPKLECNAIFACEAVRIDENPRGSWNHSRQVLGRKEYDDGLEELNLLVYDIYDLDDLYYSRVITLRSLFRDTSYCTLPLRSHISALTEATWNEKIIKEKHEGFVLFDEYSLDPKYFAKLKPENVDIDCVVLAFHEGKKGTRLEGRLGAFEVGLYKPDGSLVSIGKVPTMTDVERDKWDARMIFTGDVKYTKDGVDYPYVIQVKASEVLPSGKLRFPSYVRERTDKGHKECLWEQLGLE